MNWLLFNCYLDFAALIAAIVGVVCLFISFVYFDFDLEKMLFKHAEQWAHRRKL